ncbi:MAG: RNA-binding cell elongation regulator Jag/EloR [bacterium]
MRQVEETGKTVDEAIDRALNALGAAREDVTVEVLDPGARGMLGLGARDARVRVSLAASAAAAAHHLTERLLRLMGFTAGVYAREQEGTVSVEIRGQDLAPLIGHRGTTLEALELLLGVMTARSTGGTRTRIVVDVEGYRDRRRMTLEEMAQRAAARALRDRREIPLAPMDSRDRRIIHTALAEHPQVTTFSLGEGDSRHVVVAPRSDTAGGNSDEQPVGG